MTSAVERDIKHEHHHKYQHEKLRTFKIFFAELADFKYDLWHVHNIHRHRHGCPPLIFSDALSHDAQQWADTLALLGYAQYSETPG